MFKRRLIKKIKKQLFFNFNRKNIKFNIKHIFNQNKIAKKNKAYINKINNIKIFFNNQIVFKELPLKNGLNLQTVICHKIATNTFADMLTNLKSKRDNKDQSIMDIIDIKKKVAILFDKITQYQKLYFNSYFFSIQLKKKK